MVPSIAGIMSGRTCLASMLKNVSGNVESTSSSVGIRAVRTGDAETSAVEAMEAVEVTENRAATFHVRTSASVLSAIGQTTPAMRSPVASCDKTTWPSRVM